MASARRRCRLSADTARGLIGIGILALAVVFLPPIAADLGGHRADPALVRHDGREVESGDGRFLHVVELDSTGKDSTGLGATGQGAPVVLVHGLPAELPGS